MVEEEEEEVVEGVQQVEEEVVVAVLVFGLRCDVDVCEHHAQDREIVARQDVFHGSR